MLLDTKILPTIILKKRSVILLEKNFKILKLKPIKDQILDPDIIILK